MCTPAAVWLLVVAPLWVWAHEVVVAHLCVCAREHKVVLVVVVVVFCGDTRLCGVVWLVQGG